MSLDKIFNIAGMIVVVALVTTIVAHPASARVIEAMGKSFANVLKAAQGK